MNTLDSRLPKALEDAFEAVLRCALETAKSLAFPAAAPASDGAGSGAAPSQACSLLRDQLPDFNQAFEKALTESVLKDMGQPSERSAPSAITDWENLSLVDDHKVDEQLHASRLGQKLAHACEWELRDLGSLMGTLVGGDRPNAGPNPLSAEALSGALYKAIQEIAGEQESRESLSRAFADALSPRLKDCYRAIVNRLKDSGVAPKPYAAKVTSRPSVGGSSRLSELGGAASGSTDGRPTGPGSIYSSQAFPGSQFSTATSAPSFQSSAVGGLPAHDAHWMEVIRRLNSVTSQMGTLDGPLHSHTEIGAGRGIGEDGLPPLMAVNVIRAHREELVQASSGTVDKLVIDIVGTLFDQILSDNRLAPPLAHQIARLQLPVLRVALADVSFFSSRKHPVRRFVNRLASLGSGFEGLTEGSGALFLTRVKQIVHEIVEGEFDRPETYSAKLDELERFISEDASAALEGAGATVSLLESKETELRIQQRYMQQLQTALAEVDVPEYLREFMAQIWSQAIVVANRRHGDNDEVTLTMRKVGRDLLLSTLPKGAPAQRQRFLAQLPALMRDLKTGLKLIGLPEAAQKDFLGQLMTSHAAALKGAALSELDYNLLAKQLDTVFSAPLPTGESRASRLDAGAGNADVQPIENRFSEEEASQIGLLSEASVDWSGAVDIDLSEPEAAAGHPPQFSESAANDDVPDLAPEEVDSAHIELEGGVDIQLDLSSPDPSEASSGLGLLENLQIGFAYRMLLKDTWQKVRLNYISPGRTFFVFTHGKGQQHTVSLTARMLERMCETQRLRALESSYLMERATARARKQLAAIKRSAEKTA